MATPSGPLLPPRAAISISRLAEMCKIKLNGAQRLMLEASERPDTKTLVAACGIRSGKTYFLALSALAVAVAPTRYPETTSVNIWLAAPTHALANIQFLQFVRLVRVYFPELLTEGSVREVDGVVIMMNLAGAKVTVSRKSCERAENLVGEACDLATLDEAEQCSAEAFANIQGRLLDRAGLLRIASSPKGCTGPFYEAAIQAKRGVPGMQFVTCPSHANENVPREELARLELRLSRRQWATDVLADFVPDHHKVFDAAAIEAASTAEPEEPAVGEVYVAGWDCAGMGSDFSVLVVGKRTKRGLKVVNVSRWSRMSFQDQVDRVRQILTHYGNGDPTAVDLRIDQSGMGGPLVQQTQAAGLSARGITWTAATKSSLIRGNLGLLLERGQVELPTKQASPEMFEELTAYEFKNETDSGHRRMAAPENMHDDVVVALALVCSFVHAGGGEGRAIVNGVDRIPEPEAHRPKVEQQSEPKPRPKTAEQIEAERLVRALYPKAPAPAQDDGEPNRPGTQRPRRGPGFSSGIWDPAP